MMSLKNRLRSSSLRALPAFCMVALAAPSTPLSAQGGSVRAADYGAIPSDGADDSAALAQAIAAATRTGSGVLALSAGEYLIGSEIAVPSGLTLRGQGCGRTVLRRMDAARGQMMLRLDGTAGFTMSGISFEHNGAPEFYRSVGFRGRGSRDISVTDNCFTDSSPVPGGGDRWAVELSAEHSPSERVTVARNRVSGKLQMTAGGGAGVRTLRVTDNDIRGAKANGIGVSHLARNAVFDDVLIARNRINNSDSIGIFIGPDQPDAAGGTFRNVTVIDNIVEGLSNRFAYGIYIRAAERESSNFLISGNVLDGAGSDKDTAIRLEDDHGGGRRSFAGVEICNNTGRNFERGIWLLSVRGATLQGNRMTGTRPLIAPADQNSRIAIVREDGAAGRSC